MSIAHIIKTSTRINKAPGLNFELTTITPHMAASWLETTNTKNRKLKNTFVDRLARDMGNGRWRITGDAIRFCDDGNLLDGQHRLAACVQANVPFVTIVVYGLPRETQDVMDTGTPRTSGDVLALHGMKSTSALATAYRFLINEKRGMAYHGGQSSVTTSEIMAEHKRHPNLPLYIPSAGSFPRGVSIALVGYLRYVVSNFAGGAIDADAMVEVLKTGVPSYDGDAMHKYREKMIGGSSGLTFVAQYRSVNVYTFKFAWNKFRKQEPVRLLKWQPTNVAIDGLNLDDL